MSVRMEPRPASGGKRRTRPLRVGLVLPTMNTPGGVAFGWPEHLALAQAAEAAGFDSLWVPDELVYEFDDAPPVDWWECWTMLAALAASTTRPTIGSFVTCANYRNPALLARMAATLDEISGGRAVLGLGAGWSERQFRTFGYPSDHLVDRLEESLGIISGLLRNGSATFEGRYVRAAGATLRPSGPRPGGIPILVGGVGRRVMRLAARYADGWNAFLIGGESSLARLQPHLDAIDAACRDEGRDPLSLHRSAGLMITLSPEPFPIGPHGDWAAGGLRGTPAALANALRAFAAAGVDELQLGVWPSTPAAVETLGEVLLQLDEDG